MCHLVFKRVVYLIVLLAAMLGGVARGERASMGPIKAHSATKVTVKKGDRLTLEVELSPGADAKIKWTIGDLTVSEKPTCLLVTDHYSAGRYPVLLTVTQGLEQFVLSYELTVEPMPIGGRPRSVVVPTENSGTDLRRVLPSMFVAQSMEGLGFRDDGGGMESLASGWSPLTFSERLKTHPEARLLFGLPGHEYHVLGEKTDVWLARENGAFGGDRLPEVAANGPLGESSAWLGERLIILVEGTLRSRQLDHMPPEWTILIPRLAKGSSTESAAEQVFHTWLQIKAGKHGDILVIREKKRPRSHRQKSLTASKDGEKVHIFVIRGTAQITRTLCAPDFEECLKKSTSETLEIRAGTSLVLETDRDEVWGQGESPWLSVPHPRMLERGFAETTPQYRPEQDPRRLGPAWTLLGQGLARSPELAKLNAEKALMLGDWLVALEEIQPYLSVMGDAAHLILGRAYTGLGLSAYAKQYLDLALQFQRDDPEPHLLLAHLALSDLRWKEAAKHLSTYDKVDGADGPWVSYYHGIASDRLSDRRFARREMLSTMRQSEIGSSREAAQLFVEAIDQDSVFTSSLTTGVFYDSRVLRSRVDQELRSGPEALRVDKVGGGQFSLNFQIRGYQDPEAELKVEGLLDGKVYSDERIRVLNPIHPEIALSLALQPGGDGQQDPWLRSEMRPFLGTRILGQRRALDEIGSDFSLKSPRLNHVTLGMRTLLSKDPIPKYDDLIEPSLRELVPPDDQSHHEVRYWTGVRVFEDRSAKIAVELAQGDYRYDGRTRKFESFTSQEMILRGEHALWSYHDLRWDLSFLKRSFALSEDQRRDLDLNLAVSWSFSQTPLLSHIFGVGYEKQNSTRVSQDFSRETAQYQMRFDF